MLGGIILIIIWVGWVLLAKKLADDFLNSEVDY